MAKPFIPKGKPPGSYGCLHLDDCLGAQCPTGYLAAGWVEMNNDLREAHRIIDELRNPPVPMFLPATLSAHQISMRAMTTHAKLRNKRRG